MTDPAVEHARSVTEVNMRLAAGRQMLGGQIDIFSGLSLLGNDRDADAIRLQIHAQMDAILDATSSLALLIRTGARPT